MQLIASRNFLPLFLTQFLGAFNDNLLKNSLVILITYRFAIEQGQNAQILVTLATGLFILPFFIFSPIAGQLADKYERTDIIRLIKLAEIIIMLIATIGFLLHSSWLLMVALFTAGTHSAFFGPVKYALLPQHLAESNLLLGNAYIEAGTFLAILLGTICGGLLILGDTGTIIVSIMLLTLAVLGYLACRFIPLAPGSEPSLQINYNLWEETKKIIGFSRQNHKVFISILAISWFWFIGAVFLGQFASYVKNYLHAESTVVTLCLTIFSLGIGLGSFLCSKLLAGVVKNTYVALAALGMSIFMIDLYFASQANDFFNLPALLSYDRFTHMAASWRIMFDALLIAICAGIYIVPLYATMQKNSNQLLMARIIAANNVINALFMVLSTIMVLIMLGLSCSIPAVFLTVGILNILVALAINKSSLNT